MLWEIEIHPAAHLPDREAARVKSQCLALGVSSIREVRAARSFLIEGNITPATVEKIATGFLVDTVVETHETHNLSAPASNPKSEIPASKMTGPKSLLNVLYKPGVTDNVADSIKAALLELGHSVTAVRTCQKYWFNEDAELDRAQADCRESFG